MSDALLLGDSVASTNGAEENVQNQKLVSIFLSPYDGTNPIQWQSQGPVLIFHPWNLNQIYPVAPEGKLHQHFPKDIALLRIKFEFTALNILGTLQRQIKMSNCFVVFFYDL